MARGDNLPENSLLGFVAGLPGLFAEDDRSAALFVGPTCPQPPACRVYYYWRTPGKDDRGNGAARIVGQVAGFY
jgi:hypothetical protein